MKILILQLARFGDLYMSWAMMRALKRTRPNCQIHCLVRSRFSDALVGLDAVDKVIHLPSQVWAQSIADDMQFNADTQFSQSVDHVGQFIDTLRNENYDQIINISFSPISSYITHAVSAGTKTRCTGYGRFNDGTFQCHDSISTYFYDQVGEIRSNRIHVTDLIAAMADVDLVDSDFKAPNNSYLFSHSCQPQKTILLHVGASQKKKALAGFQWSRIVKSFLKIRPEFEIALVGAPQEKYIADEILAQNSDGRVISYVGQTKVPQLFDLLKSSHSVIACDSMLVQMASLTNTPCFNISFESVNFWETGPLAIGSVVYRIDKPENINSYETAEKWSNYVTGKNVQGTFHSQKGLPRFNGPSTPSQDFQWNLLQALYLNQPFPVTDDALFCECVEKLYQLNDLLIDNLKKFQDKNFPYASLLLNQTENTLMSMGKYHEGAAVLIRWYRGRKITIPPLSQNEIINEYLKVHLEFRSILKVYLWVDNEIQNLKKD